MLLGPPTIMDSNPIGYSCEHCRRFIRPNEARAHKRACAFKQTQNQRFMAQLDAEREQRWQNHLVTTMSPDNLAIYYRKLAELEQLSREEEADRERHDVEVKPLVHEVLEVEDWSEAVEPIEFEPIPLLVTAMVVDVYDAVHDRLGETLNQVCSIASLYRFSHAQLNYVLDPEEYSWTEQVTKHYNNFNSIVRSIDAHRPFSCDAFSVFCGKPQLKARAASLLEVDVMRQYVNDNPTSWTSNICHEYDFLLLRRIPPGERIVPHNYGLNDLADDAKAVERLLKYIMPSDSSFVQPASISVPVLQPAPYIPILHQLPVRDIYRGAQRRVAAGRVPGCPPCEVVAVQSNIRIIGLDGYVPVLFPTDEQREQMKMMIVAGDLPSGSHSMWDSDPDDDSM